MLVRLLPVGNLDKSKPLVMRINAASRYQRAATEQRLLHAHVMAMMRSPSFST